MGQLGPAFAEFGQRLRRARRPRFATATELARELGWSQSRVSKLETGHRLPRDDELAAWAQAAGLDRDGAEELHAALGTARIEQALSSPPEARSGVGEPEGLAEAYLRRVRADFAAGTIVEYAPAVLPLIAATPEYAAAVVPLLGSDTRPGVLRSIQQQRVKHQELLYDDRAEVVLVIEAAALESTAVAVDVLARQRERLLALARLPALSVEVRPPGRPGPRQPTSALVIHDERAAVVGGPPGGELVGDPVEVAGWAQVMAGYRDQALRGERARAHLRHPQPGRTAA